MKSILIFFACFFCALSPVFSQYYTVKVKSSLIVCEAPYTNSQSLGSLPNGEVVFVHEVNNGWAKIKYQRNYGYLSMDFLEENIKMNETHQEMLSYATIDQGWWGNILSWLDKRGVLGGIVLYLIIPIPFFIIFIGLPIMLLSFISFKWFKNIHFTILSCIYAIPACLLLWGNITQHYAYSGIWPLGVLVFLYALLWCLISNINASRCPECCSSKTHVIDENMSNHNIKTVTEITKDIYDREIDRSVVSRKRSITHNKYRECKKCGFKWWNSEVYTS